MTAVLSAYTLSECMEIMSEYAAAYEQQGGKNIIFCEDRLTLVAERALARKTGGTFFSSVTTFSRFLQTDEKVLSKQGSVMATGAIMAALQREKKLRCFKTTEGIKNAAKIVYETLAQFSASRIDPETLETSGNLLPEGVLKQKVLDLALIYAEYGKFLKEKGYVDESGYLSLLPKYLETSGKIDGVNVFFLCYSAFTAQAMQTVKACLSRAKNVVGVFCSGKEELYTNGAQAAFLSACKEYGAVSVRALGVPVDGVAEELRKSLFNPFSLDEGKRRSVKTDKIRMFEGEDKSAEAEYAAANVKKLVAENPSVRYRDIAVLVSDTAGYSLPIKKAFEEYGIPYFFDVKKSLKAHPLSKFLLSCFAVQREGYSPVTVQALLSSVFFGNGDNYRNYLLKYGAYRGGAKREIKDSSIIKGYDREELVLARKKLLTVVESVPKKGTGKAYCNAVRTIMETVDAKKGLDALELATKDVAMKSYLSQIFSAVEKVLEEAELLTGEEEMTCAEFEAVLVDGLSATEISLIPLKADAVFVGDVADSRIEKVTALFALGMTDAVPRSADDTALVSDKEIEKLAEVKTLVQPTVQEVNMRTRESVGLNLCTFTDKLFLSYSLSSKGEPPALSEIFQYLRIFADENGGELQAEKRLPEGDLKYECSAVSPAIRRLILEKKDFENGRKNSQETYSALYKALQSVSGEEDGFLQENQGETFIEDGEALFFGNRENLSPTLLEGYFRCPFGNFAARGLKTKEREEAAVLAVDSGNFVHEILEKTGKKFSEFSSEDEARAFAQKTGEELLKLPVYLAQSDTAAGEYASKNLLREGVEAAVAAYRQIAGSLYSVEDAEKTVSTPDFYGKVDRVDATDEYVRVVDYKTGYIEDKPVDYYTGRKLQRQLYLSAVQGDRIPAAVFYFPASVSYKNKGEVNFRMSGYINGDKAAILAGDTTLAEGEESAFFNAKLETDSKRGSVMDEETFRDFIDYGVLAARGAAKEIKKGFIAPTPYDGACRYCKFGGMCGFNYDLSAPRKESAPTPKEIAAIARRKKEGKEEEYLAAIDGEEDSDA